MKKFLVSIVAALLAIPSFGQTNSGNFSISETSFYYGVRLGANFASISGDKTDDAKTKTGFNLGGVVGLRVSETTPLFLESGLYYTQRGAKGDGDYKLNLNYLEIPVLIKYGFQATEDISVLPYVGPYFSMGIAGKIKGEGDSVGSFSDEGGYNRPDMGFKIGCGAEYNMLYAEIGYQFGVANIYDSDKISQHGNALFFNIGVNF